MNFQFDQPKNFNELIDMISAFISRRFKKLFLIVLFLIGPFLILKYFFLFLSDKPFIAQMMRVDDMRLAILQKITYPVVEGRFEFYARMVSTYPIYVILPFTFMAIIGALSQLNRGYEFSVGSVIKDSLSSFWEIVGACIAFALICIVAYFSPTLIIQPIVNEIINSLPGWGIPLAYVVTILVYLLLGCILLRFSFFIPYAHDKDVPGLKESWHLTRNGILSPIGIAITLGVILLLFRYILESLFIFLVGDSILLVMIMDVYFVFALLILTVSYAVLYLNLINKARNH